jgi:hypothetical protein
LIPMFEVQLHIPPVFPQSQQIDGSSPSNALSHPAALRRFVPRSVEW